MEHVRLPDQTLAPVGQGAMARVYRAHDPVRGREIAIKILKDADPESWTRLRREAAAQGSLDHPNICKVYGHGEQEGQFFILMEFVDGRPLDEVAPSISLDARIRLFVDVCDAVEHAHRAGLIHRDLKPGNILVSENGGKLHPYVMDFGLVRRQQDSTLTAAGDVLGTPSYMSPEQAAGRVHELDRRTDVFSLGCVLFHLLTGRPPFIGDSVSEVVGQLLTQDAPSPRRFNAILPSALCRICLQCLERTPQRRYASVAQLRQDLLAYLGGDSVSARKVGWMFELLRRVRRNRFSSAAIGLLLLSTLLAGAYALHASVDARQREQRAAVLVSAAAEVRQHMLIARLAPLHDLSQDVQPLRARLDALEADLANARGAGLHLSRRALGEAWLDLDEIDRARPLIETGARSEDAQPVDWINLANLRIRELDRLTQPWRDLADAERIALLGPEGQRLHAEALSSLERAARSGKTFPALQEAQLRRLERRWEQALEAARGHPAAFPGDYAAQSLIGEIELERSRELLQNGSLEQARAASQRANAALDQAWQSGRSDVRLMRALCMNSSHGLRVQSLLGQSPPTTPEQLSAACAALAIADPGGSGRELSSAWAAIARAFDTRNQASAMRAPLEQALREAQRALDANPADRVAALAHADAHSRLATLRYDEFENAQAHFDAAISTLEPLHRQQPKDLSILAALAGLHRDKGRHLNNYDRSPDDQFAHALELMRSAMELRPDAVMLREDLSTTLVYAFYRERDRDEARAIRLAEESIDVLQPALDARPDHPDVLYTQGANHGDLAIYLRGAQAGSGRYQARVDAHFERALALLGHLRTVAPDRPEGYGQAFMVLMTIAELDYDLGVANFEVMERARELLELAESRGVKLIRAARAWHAAELAKAHSLSAHSPATPSPAPHFDHARALIAKVPEDADDADGRIYAERNLIALDTAWMRWRARTGTADLADVDALVARLIAEGTQARGIAQFTCDAAEILRIKADLVEPSLRRSVLEQSVHHFQRCMGFGPIVQRFRIPRLEEAQRALASLETEAPSEPGESALDLPAR